MRPSKIRVVKYEQSATSKWVVEGPKSSTGNAITDLLRQNSTLSLPRESNRNN